MHAAKKKKKKSKTHARVFSCFRSHVSELGKKWSLDTCLFVLINNVNLTTSLVHFFSLLQNMSVSISLLTARSHPTTVMETRKLPLYSLILNALPQTLMQKTNMLGSKYMHYHYVNRHVIIMLLNEAVLCKGFFFSF